MLTEPGFELPAATQMNEEAFEAISIEKNNESCPKWKRTSAYKKSDYYFMSHSIIETNGISKYNLNYKFNQG
jgi:hypothetical protein